MSTGNLHSGDLAPTVVVRRLTKRYGDYTILDRLDIDLPAASLVGLLGPNGAGKTTLLKLLVGLITPDEGTIQIGGYDLRKQEAQARRQLAYVPDVPNLYPELTVYEHLELMARAHNALATFEEDARTILERFGLWAARNSPTFALSRGMSQKLAICGAFVRPSRIVLMDEPGGSLDIGSVAELYELLKEYRQYGGTALLSSHQWETLQDICDYFVLLTPGGVLTGNLGTLRQAAELPLDSDLRSIYLALMDPRLGLSQRKGQGPLWGGHESSLHSEDER